MKYITVITLVVIIIMATFHDVGMVKIPALDTTSEVIRGQR
ncbi:hypothetical protein PR1_74 [Providencia phage vB_PreS_PR1]|uniref:Uncharacterized protein n=1 Tax=Providencia phage vB_PreS_PR1 TaxID=1931407 RepID=A0A1S6KVA8_9CAUD|nr:hypothetical protein FDH30_gp141 [Providencia phage vB_PreS_PR1]AQT25370.1 hypothetical protein PR1_74 [Providencia phage vB_PreS_PR1]